MIPCYNEEATIGSVILKAKQYADEVTVVDDGSIDNTVKVAEFAGANVIKHGGNKGYGAAIQSCSRYARENNFDVLAILDGDGQHDAEQLPYVISPVLDNKVDVSIGSRFVENNGNDIPRYRRFGINFLTKLTNAGSKDKHRITDGQSGFRAYSRKAIEMLNPKDPDMGVSAEILLQGRKKNLSYEEVPISCRYDLNGSSKKPVGHGIGVIISILQYLEVQHSLLFFSVPGFIIFIFGLITGLNVYFSYRQTGFLQFGPTILMAILLFSGLLLGLTGLILHAVINANRRDYGRFKPF
jgi:glycosyltransferase involved in cell wall biosynthesis